MCLEKSHLQGTLPVYPRSPTEMLSQAMQEQSEEGAPETAEEFRMSASKRAQLSIATSACTTWERAEHAKATFVTGEQTVKKLEVVKVRTVSVATDNGPPGAAIGSKRSGVSQALESGNTRSHPPSNEVMNIGEISFDAQLTNCLFSAWTYKFGVTFKISRIIQVPALFIHNTGAGPNFISKLTVPPS